MREIDSNADSTDVDMMFEMVEWLGEEGSEMRKVAARTKEGETARILNVGELGDTFPNRYPILNGRAARGLASNYVAQSDSAIKHRL